MIPEKLFLKHYRLGLVVTGFEEFGTAGGATVRVDVTIGQVEWLGEVRSVTIIILGESRLVGSHLLDGARLTMITGAAPSPSSVNPPPHLRNTMRK